MKLKKYLESLDLADDTNVIVYDVSLERYISVFLYEDIARDTYPKITPMNSHVTEARSYVYSGINNYEIKVRDY